MEDGGLMDEYEIYREPEGDWVVTINGSELGLYDSFLQAAEAVQYHCVVGDIIIVNAVEV